MQSRRGGALRIDSCWTEPRTLWGFYRNHFPDVSYVSGSGRQAPIRGPRKPLEYCCHGMIPTPEARNRSEIQSALWTPMCPHASIFAPASGRKPGELHDPQDIGLYGARLLVAQPQVVDVAATQKGSSALDQCGTWCGLHRASRGHGTSDKPSVRMSEVAGRSH